MRNHGFMGLVVLCSLVPATIRAQGESTVEHQTALMAGHRSMFTCSATFNAGRSMDDIMAGELNERFVQAYFAGLEVSSPVIDRDRRQVSTRFSDVMPARISVWRPHLGCAVLPIGAGPEAADSIPRIELETPQGDRSALDWPDGDRTHAVDWEGIDRGALESAVDRAFDRKSYGQDTETTAALVVRDGQIVIERYRQDFDLHTSQRTWSVAKSIAATLIGIAVGQGRLKLEAPAPIPEWQTPGDPRQAITLANLLHMGSGLYSGRAGNRTDFIYFGGGSVTEYAVRHPLEAKPGSRWKYANNDTMLAARALRAALGDDQTYLEFPFRELLFRIGMLDTVPETDWQGNFIFSSQVWTTARDLARLGMLYLNDGVWNGERILPEGWADYVRTPAPSQPPPRGEGPNLGYGAQFWLLAAFPGLPADTHAMLGNRGQIVILLPSQNVLIVRRGFDASGAGVRFDAAAFAVDVLQALESG